LRYELFWQGDYASPTLNYWLGKRQLRILNRVDPEIVQTGEGLYSRQAVDITFAESYEGG
jgi:hypothetical protein